MPPTSGACRITVDDEPIAAQPGDTVAAAMLRAGQRTFCRARGDAPRRPFCGMGVCHDCLVTIDGAPSQRACMASVRDGMAVKRQSAAAVPLGAAASFPETVTSACDVLIVGAGPAGLAAALACGPGLSLRVVDERPTPGGQFYKQPASGGGDRQARGGARLIAGVREAGVTITGNATVWGAFRSASGTLEIGVMTPERGELIRPRLLVVAAGAYERPLIVPGWTLPGVMTVGAAQGFARGFGVVPGARVVVAGNGPLVLQLACELLGAGADVVAVALSASPPWHRPSASWRCLRSAPHLMAQGARYLATLRRHRVKVLYRHVLSRIDGDTQARAAWLAPLAQHGTASRFDADLVCIGYGFLPSNALPRLLGCEHRAAAHGPGLETVRDDAGETSQPDVLVIGEAGGFAGAQVALAQGELAGTRIREKLGLQVATPRSARTRLARARAFQDGLREIFAAPDAGLSLADDVTIVCRCESVTLGVLRAAIARHGLTDAGMLKRATRAGMGRCQARYCGEHIDALLHPGTPPQALRGFAPQVPMCPVPAGAFAAEAPEWGGHLRVALPRRAAPKAGVLPVHEAETVVVGGGIAGLSTAWHLARAGRSVVVLDRGEPGAEASGGNAGSLHVQLLSFDFAGESGGATTPAARTLALQRDAVSLWHEIEPALGGDLELRLTGGLMVAETQAELAALRHKIALERACGIEVELIGPAELYALEPLLRPGLLGAAFCPQEGKINPLLATQAMLDAARASGAVVLARTEVVGIRREAAGFTVTTQSGSLRAGNVVNAAGAWAAGVAAMLGAKIPVFGAPLQMIVTEPVQPALGRLLAHAGRHLTLKQAASGGFIIGGGWSAALDPVHFHPRPLRESLAGNLFVACRVLPPLARAHVVRSWAAMNIDIDRAPILGGHPGIAGLFHAVGSNGFTLGPLFGRITADLILHGDAGRDIAAFSASRFVA